MSISRYAFRAGTRIAVAVIVVAALLVAGRIIAQTSAPLGNAETVRPVPGNPPTVPGAPLPGVSRHAVPEDLIGKTVHDARDTRVGRIEAAQLDAQGNVKGVVVALGGVGGIGARPVTVERHELQLGDDGETVKTRLTKDELDRRPAPAK